MREQKAMYLSTELDTEIRTFTEGTSYELIRTAVEGWIECVHLPSLGVDMWLNEEGKLIDLPQNDIATYLFCKEFEMFDSIRGNVIFTGGAGSEGETLGLSEEQIKSLTELLKI